MEKALEPEEKCRAATPGPAESIKALPAALFVLFVAAFWGWGTFVNNVAVADEFDPVKTEYRLWTVLIGMIGGFAAAAGLYFVCWLVGALRLHTGVQARTVAVWLGAVVAVGGTVLASLFIGSSSADQSIDKSLADQTRPVTWFAAVCLAPGLMGFLALRSIARSSECWTESNACRLRLLLRLRAELRRLLAILGAFLTLLVIATGTRRRALLALDPHLDVPSEAVLLYGLVFAGVLAIFYLAANSAIDARARTLLDGFAPLPDPGDAQSSDFLRRRNDLGAAMGLDAGSWRTFESTVVVAAPLISALIGVSTG